jgi:hypothetical protein
MILFLDFDGVLHAIGKNVFGDQKKIFKVTFT